jgi:hypothetical protein
VVNWPLHSLCSRWYFPFIIHDEISWGISLKNHIVVGACIPESALSKCFSCLTLRLTINSEIGWITFICLLLVLQVIVESTNYSTYSSLLWVRLSYLERSDSAFLFLWLVSFAGFNCFWGHSFAQKVKRKTFSGNSFSFKMSFLLLLVLSNWSMIGHIVVIFVTIVTPHFERSNFRLAYSYAIGNWFLLFTGRVSSRTICVSEFFQFSRRLSYEIASSQLI